MSLSFLWSRGNGLEGRCEMSRMWRIVYYAEDGRSERVEVVRKCRPTRLAKALMCEDYIRFDIQRVV